MQYLKSFPLWNVVLGERVRGKMKATQPINSPLTTFATNYFSSADDSQIQDESAGEAAYRRLCQCDKPLAVCVLSVFLTVGSWQVMLGFFTLGAQCRPTVSCFHFQCGWRSPISTQRFRGESGFKERKTLVWFSLPLSVLRGPSVLIRKLWWGILGPGTASRISWCWTGSQ